MTREYTDDTMSAFTALLDAAVNRVERELRQRPGFDSLSPPEQAEARVGMLQQIFPCACAQCRVSQ